MLRTFIPCIALLLVAGALAAEETPSSNAVAKADAEDDRGDDIGGDAKGKAAKAETDAKALSGMSILGNQEAPKALVIVPWKSSQLGDALGISKTLDDSRQAVDKDVFMRELAYYEIRTNSK